MSSKLSEKSPDGFMICVECNGPDKSEVYEGLRAQLAVRLETAGAEKADLLRYHQGIHQDLIGLWSGLIVMGSGVALSTAWEIAEAYAIRENITLLKKSIPTDLSVRKIDPPDMRES